MIGKTPVSGEHGEVFVSRIWYDAPCNEVVRLCRYFEFRVEFRVEFQGEGQRVPTLALACTELLFNYCVWQ